MSSLNFDAEKIRFRAFYDVNTSILDNAKTSFLTLIRSLLVGTEFAAVATGRVKAREESIRKFERKYQNLLEEAGTPYEIKDHITDLIGLRLVCLYDDQIEPIGELIKSQLEVLGVTDKVAAIEGTENSFGYKGLHLDLKLNGARAELPEYAQFAPFRFELQIRTIIQDSWSTLDHKIKYKKSIPAALKRRINTLAALFELADREFRYIRDETEAAIRSAETEETAGDDQAPAAADQGQVGDIGPGQYAPLDAFRFLRIAHHFFPQFHFEPHKVDGFTAEVVRLEPGISRGKLNFYLRETIGQVRRYKEHFLRSGMGPGFNPFTEMRHCLYAANPASFSSMLRAHARESFDAWRREEGAGQPLTRAARPRASGAAASNRGGGLGGQVVEQEVPSAEVDTPEVQS